MIKVFHWKIALYGIRIMLFKMIRFNFLVIYQFIELFFPLDYGADNQTFLLNPQTAHWSSIFSLGDGIYMEGF